MLDSILPMFQLSRRLRDGVLVLSEIGEEVSVWGEGGGDLKRLERSLICIINGKLS
jgi:hypothetical protein